MFLYSTLSLSFPLNFILSIMNISRRQPSGHPSALSRNRWAYAEYETEGNSDTKLTVEETLNDFRDFFGLYGLVVTTHQYIPITVKFQHISVWAIDYLTEPIGLTLSALDTSGVSTTVEQNMISAVGYAAHNQFARVKLSWPFPHNRVQFIDSYTIHQNYQIARILVSTGRKFMMRLGIQWKPIIFSLSTELRLFPRHRYNHSSSRTSLQIHQFDRGRSARRIEEQDPHSYQSNIQPQTLPSISHVDNDVFECDASFSSPSSSDGSFEMI